MAHGAHIGSGTGAKARRGMHLFYGTIVLYYLFPSTVFDFPTDFFFVIFMVVCPLQAEYVRLRHGLLWTGMRPHERGRLASYVWFIFGAAFLILFFPQQIAAPCILATALVDPAISATRGWRRRYTVSLNVCLAAAIFFSFGYSVPLAVFAGGLAVLAESVDLRLRASLRPGLTYSRSGKRTGRLNEFFDTVTRFDDDFTMQVLPALVLVIMYLNAPWMFPEPLLHAVVPVEEWTLLVNEYLGIG